MSIINYSLLFCNLVLLYGDVDRKSRHIGCFDPDCDVLKIAQGDCLTLAELQNL